MWKERDPDDPSEAPTLSIAQGEAESFANSMAPRRQEESRSARRSRRPAHVRSKELPALLYVERAELEGSCFLHEPPRRTIALIKCRLQGGGKMSCAS